MAIKKRAALALLQKELDSRLAAEEIAAILAAAADAEDAQDQLAALHAQITTAEATLAEIRATAERENLDRKQRINEARGKIEKAETDARARVQEIERESAERVTAERRKADTDLAAVKKKAEEDVAAVRADLARERGLLSQITAQVEEARRSLAPFMGRA